MTLCNWCLKEIQSETEYDEEGRSFHPECWDEYSEHEKVLKAREK